MAIAVLVDSCAISVIFTFSSSESCGDAEFPATTTMDNGSSFTRYRSDSGPSNPVYLPHLLRSPFQEVEFELYAEDLNHIVF